MKNPSALIIEDDPKLAMIYETALQQVGFETDLDMDGNRYLEKMTAVKPDLILLDLHLPYASGIDIFHQVHNDARWADIPIVVVTADLQLAKKLEGLTEHVLIKPVGVPRLQGIATRLWSQRAQASPDLSEQKSPMTNSLALIIEDDPQLNQIFTLTLQFDFEINTVTDGKAGLEQLQKIIPDLIILDLNLPLVSGKELLRYIKSDQRLAKTRVILATANSLEAEQMRAQVDLVLLKPISPGQLRLLALRLKGKAHKQ